MHGLGTRIGHNAGPVTLFDIADLSEPPAQGRAATLQPVATPRKPTDVETATGSDQADGGGGTDGDAVEPAPEVEVRISKRRKKTSEAKWVGGRIVVSLPAHLDVESRQKTIDWLVERLLTRHRLQSGLDDDELLARAVELSDRYLVGAHASVRPLGHQPDGALGLVLVLLGPHPGLTPPARRARLGARLRLVHEVAHLTYPDHSPAFHRLAGAYPRHEEAGVFLAGYGLGLSNPSPSSVPD